MTLEYALIAGGNDTPEEAGQLARIARELDAKVNLIACNPTASTHRAPDARAIAAFERRLAAAGARVTVRRSKGEEIAAACGQLRRQPSPST
ncbi:MAG: putative dual-specificity RNA methyltransferase RlmN [Lentisphaerae bacterium ADurb.BinA184]|nr:MAG: putative dual-specificity RNA methyltransferase RlmN [Lentisphaerae bacterium ADurb.BinA184]